MAASTRPTTKQVTHHDLILSDYLDGIESGSIKSPEFFRETGDSDLVVLQKWLDSGEPVLRTGKLNYVMTGHLIIDRPVVIINEGSTFEQTLWGYPCFEIKSKDIKLLGLWEGNYLGDRSVVITGNTLGYPYVTSGDWKAYGSFIWMNYYESRDISGFYLESVRAYGFIAGVWATGADMEIGESYFDTVDFGIFGVVFDNQRIGNIYHKNITASQGHEGHALYTNGTGKGFVFGNIYVEGSPLACSPLKLHRTKGFRGGTVSGVGLAGVAYFMDGATGSFAGGLCICDVNANFTGPGQDPSEYNLLVSGSGTEITITGAMVILANQQGVVKVAATQVSGTGATLTFAAGYKYVNSNSSPQQPSAHFTTSGGKIHYLGGFDIQHPNSLATSPIINNLGDGGSTWATPPRVRIGAGGEVFLLRNTYTGTGATNSYSMPFDPALIYPGTGPNLITCTQNTYWGHQFWSTGKAFNSLTSATPIVTHTGQAIITQSVATDLTRLRYMSPGQRLTLRNGDGNSNIAHNRVPGLDGNIITHTGADISRTTWKFATFTKIGLDVYLISII